MNSSDVERLRRYVDAAVVPRFNTDRRKYPMYAGRLGRLYLDIFASELDGDLREFEVAGGTTEELAQLFRTPSRIMRMAHTVLAGLRLAKRPLEEQREVILKLLDIVSAMKHGSEFCEDGRNVILSPTELDALASRPELQTADRDSARAFQRLAGTLWAYAETLYFVCHGIGMEAHGPYASGGRPGSVSLVRDFFNLRPTELWLQCKRVPFESICLVGEYNGLDAWFDVFDNLYVRNGNLVSALCAYGAIADGKPLDASQMSTLAELLNKVVVEITSEVDSWTEKQVAGKYMDIFWYQVKPLKDRLKRRWQPPSTVLERVETNPIPPHSDTRPTEQQLREEMSLV